MIWKPEEREGLKQNGDKFLLLALITLSICSKAIAQVENYQCIEPPNLQRGFEASFRELANSEKKIALLGETHGVSVTYELYEALIRTLNGNGDFKNILCERSYAEALLFNKFLETKNEAYLKFDVAWSKEMKALLYSLYEYNFLLPNDKKLRFIGIDAIHSSNAFVLGIKNLLPEKPAPQIIAPFIDSLKKISLPLSFKPKKSSEYFNHLDNLLSSFKKEIDKNRLEYKDYFGDDFVHVEAIVNSKSTYSNPGRRNREMFDNIVSITRNQQITSSFVGLFGINHVMKFKSLSPSFADLINENSESPFSSRVARILIHYENCFADFQDKKVKVPSLLSNLTDKKENAVKAKMCSEAGCPEFILKISPGDKLLSKQCDYIIFVSDKGPMERF